jgi:hypothetical protein
LRLLVTLLQHISWDWKSKVAPKSTWNCFTKGEWQNLNSE